MKTRIILALLLAVFSLVGGFPLACAQDAPPSSGTPQSLPKVTLHIGKATLDTEVASTVTQREIGLMYRTKMDDNDGMIFAMGAIGPATFWMKNTLISLSVAFIDKNGVILEIHDMQPEDFSKPHRDSDLPITRSESNQVAYALETNLHWFALNDIKPGDKIDPAPGTLIKTAQ